jgi:hypothetical protein
MLVCSKLFALEISLAAIVFNRKIQRTEEVVGVTVRSGEKVDPITVYSSTEFSG